MSSYDDDDVNRMMNEAVARGRAIADATGPQRLSDDVALRHFVDVIGQEITHLQLANDLGGHVWIDVVQNTAIVRSTGGTRLRIQFNDSYLILYVDPLPKPTVSRYSKVANIGAFTAYEVAFDSESGPRVLNEREMAAEILKIMNQKH